MQPLRAHAWIFLTLSDEPSARTDMIGVADAIDHAVPTREELQDSLGWLIANGLVAKEGQAYRYTEKGAGLRSDADQRSGTAQAAWNQVEKRLQQIAQPAQSSDEIAPEDYDRAVKAYEQWFRDTYRLLTGK